MFKTELTIEEEVLMQQLLDGKILSRVEFLKRVNSLVELTSKKEIDGLLISKSLFDKVKNTSDFEFNEYVSLML